jgi:hypothetical protein
VDFADDVSLLGDGISIVKKKAETVINASKEAGLEVNTENNVAVSSPEYREES